MRLETVEAMRKLADEQLRVVHNCTEIPQEFSNEVELWQQK